MSKQYRSCVPASVARSSSPFGLGSSLLDDFLRLAEGRTVENPVRASFPLNVTENAEGYKLEANLPATQKDQVDISVEDGKLSIIVEGAEDTDLEYAIQEWKPASGSRILALPTDANPESLKATLIDGVLTIKIAKLEEKQPRRVEIH